MDDYVCIDVQSDPDEPADIFNKRLIAFWSHMLRSRPSEYLRVHAESAQSESHASRWSRKYLVGVDVVDVLADEMARAGIYYGPIDRDDLYSKYEAAPPEWFQIPH